MNDRAVSSNERIISFSDIFFAKEFLEELKKEKSDVFLESRHSFFYSFPALIKQIDASSLLSCSQNNNWRNFVLNPCTESQLLYSLENLSSFVPSIQKK